MVTFTHYTQGQCWTDLGVGQGDALWEKLLLRVVVVVCIDL